MDGIGWFAYEPVGSASESAPVATPEELAAAAAQRSIPASGVRRVTEDISDDDLYAALIEFLGGYGMARETTPGVIRVDIADNMYPTGRQARLPLEVYLSRAQLRRLARAEFNVADDTDPRVLPRTTHHVEVGFDDLTFGLEESFESGLGDRSGVQPGHLVYDEETNRLRYRDEPPGAPQR